MLNFGVMLVSGHGSLKESDGTECVLGIVATMFTHYLVYLAIFFRCYRLYRMWALYEKHLAPDLFDRQLIIRQTTNMSGARLTSNLESQSVKMFDTQSKQLLSKMKSLKEKNLIITMFIIVGVIAFFGLLSAFIPEIYILCPVFESQDCWEFFKENSESSETGIFAS